MKIACEFCKKYQKEGASTSFHPATAASSERFIHSI